MESKDAVDQRFYASTYGRFNTPDLSGAQPGSPASWNRYSYTEGDPVNNVDPSGQFTQSPCALWGSASWACDPFSGLFWPTTTVPISGPSPEYYCLMYNLPGCGPAAQQAYQAAQQYKANCDTSNPTNAKVINFIKADAADASRLAAATGLSSDLILAWAAYESGYGTSNKANVNNNFFGLTGGTWAGAVNCPSSASAGFACFRDPGLLDSGESALFSQNSRYLQAALDAQASGGNIAAIANAIAAAGFNSEYTNGGYGSNVNDAAQAIANRKNCP